MKKLLVLIAAFIGTAYAAGEPAIIGSFPNKDGGEIVLSSELCKQETTRRIAYITSGGGRITLFGCWQLIGEKVFIKYSDGDLFTYPVELIRFTEEFNTWYNKKNKGTEYAL